MWLLCPQCGSHVSHPHDSFTSNPFIQAFTLHPTGTDFESLLCCVTQGDEMKGVKLVHVAMPLNLERPQWFFVVGRHISFPPLIG